MCQSSRMKRPKDVVTYPSLQWDIALFLCLGWDDEYLLPYVFHSLQGFLGELAMSLDEDTTLNYILQTLDKHYGIVMMFNTLGKELYSLKQGSGENMAEFGAHW